MGEVPTPAIEAATARIPSGRNGSGCQATSCRRQTGITTAQAWLQTVLWAALFLFGFTFPALDDNHGGTSILLRLIGQGPLTSALSGLLWTLSAFAAWGVGIALLALLIIGIDSKRQHVSAGPSSTAGQLAYPR